MTWKNKISGFKRILNNDLKKFGKEQFFKTQELSK